MKLSLLVGLIAQSFLFSNANAAPAKLPRDYLRIPVVAQATDYSCGAAALLAVLQYWRAYDGTESSLYPMLHTTPKDGTEPNMISEVAATLGLTASYREGMSLEDLEASLSRGDTVILDIQAWRDSSKKQKDAKPPSWSDDWDDGHYVVLIGMDAEYAYFMDPSATAAYGYIPLPELLDRWHDYEDRNGRTWRYYNLGITIRGKTPLKNFPGALTRID